MEKWISEKEPLRAVACDLRGYSPGATPSNPEQYEYKLMVEDVYGIADASGFDKFHLVGHDHGAGLAWYTAGTDRNRTEPRLLSLAALSVPHPDSFSSAVYGADASEPQVVASNYFRQFQLVDSASRNDGNLTKLFRGLGSPGLNPQDLQPQLWWYYGSIGRYLAAPPVVGAEVVDPYLPGAALVALVQAAIPLEEDAGSSATSPTGPIASPTLLVCGERDPYLLCSEPWAFNAEDVTASYTYHGADCAHNLLSTGPTECSGARDVDGVMAAITSHILEYINTTSTNSWTVVGTDSRAAPTTASAASLPTFLAAALLTAAFLPIGGRQ
mmetsp:Transcript_31043/g.87972  ORF Transcript_31043/g.87972 Transcript_31043/m.87972 type:complete len:328 (-) Transcript_31043:2544-3527(-)